MFINAPGLLTSGAGYFDDLADVQRVFVDSKKRQLRFAAFGVVNKIDASFPRTKIAIIKRAYRKKPPDPRNVWCSNPEAAWITVHGNILQSVEHMLLYLHETELI